MLNEKVKSNEKRALEEKKSAKERQGLNSHGALVFSFSLAPFLKGVIYPLSSCIDI